MNWEEVALHCYHTYGTYIDWKEHFFICPDCQEPIYQEDWEFEDLDICPVCEFQWFEEE